MSFIHTITRSWTSSSGGSRSQSSSQTAGEELNVSESIPASSTNLQVALTLDVSQMKSLFICSDRDMTLKTNSSGAPDDTLALKANQPIIWQYGDPMANPLTVDVTALFATLASGEAATLDIRALVDPTV